MKHNFANLLFNLKNRRSMYLFDDTYAGLATYLMGYFQGVQEISGKTPNQAFQEWLIAKQGNHFSLHWSRYILQEMVGNDPIQAIDTLLELLEEFTAERQN
jgi:hypothetical protein